MKARVLIDFDNVVLKTNPKARAYLRRRNEAYIGRTVKTINPKVSSELLHCIQNSCGHVALGLQRLGYEHATVDDYNSFVYPKNFDYNVIWCDGAYHDKEILDTLFRLARDSELYVFSTSPLEWNYNFLRLANMGVADHVKYLTPKEPKPLKAAFDCVEATLGNRGHVYYIDSDPKNLLCAFGRPMWTVLGISEMYDEKWSSVDRPLMLVRDLREAYESVWNAMYQMPPK